MQGFSELSVRHKLQRHFASKPKALPILLRATWRRHRTPKPVCPGPTCPSSVASYAPCHPAGSVSDVPPKDLMQASRQLLKLLNASKWFIQPPQRVVGPHLGPHVDPRRSPKPCQCCQDIQFNQLPARGWHRPCNRNLINKY